MREPSTQDRQLSATSRHVGFAPNSVIEAGLAIARQRTSSELGGESRLCQQPTWGLSNSEDASKLIWVTCRRVWPWTRSQNRQSSRQQPPTSRGGSLRRWCPGL